MIRAMILLVVLSVSTQMQTCKKKAKDTTTVTTKSKKVSQVKKVVIDRSMTPVPSIDDLKIIKAEISQSLLTITFSFSGTADDDFDLIFNGLYMKSLPMQATVRLKQVKKSGKVASQTKTMIFDVEPMKASGTELHIKLDGYSEKLIYKYSEK